MGEIRNIAVVGHSGVGKTSVIEQLAFSSGLVGRLGRVDDASCTYDTDPEGQKRGHTLGLTWSPVDWHGTRLNFLDTPGTGEFQHDVTVALHAADAALFVVHAGHPVEVQTELAWDTAAALALPRIVFVNHLDRDSTSFEKAVGALQERFGAGLAPLGLMVGSGPSLNAVIDLLADECHTYSQPGKAVSSSGPVPAAVASTEHTLHESLVEGIVVADEALTERYLEGDPIGFHELEVALASGVRAGSVFPVLGGSALSGVGVDLLAHLLVEVLPAPAQSHPRVATAGPTNVEIAADPAGPTVAHVVRTTSDPYLGRVSLLRVDSGTLRADVTLINTRTRTEERLHALLLPKGKEQKQQAEVSAGDYVITTKLLEAATGDTLAQAGSPVALDVPEPPAAVYFVAIKPRTRGDEDKLMTALHRLEEEDVTLSVRRDDETHQTLLGGSGDTHVAVALERLARKFGVAVDVEPIVVPYRETITAPATAEGKHKKQAGGHGQFAVATLTIEPLARGEGFVFHDEVVGGAIPRQFIPAVERGVAETMAHGGVWGFPVVDVAVRCQDGKHHPVDSSELAFKLAGGLAFRQAMAKATPVLLEPIDRLDVVIPTDVQGDVLGHLNSRRGRVQSSEAIGSGHQRVVALIPHAEALSYAVELRSLAGGRGAFTARHDHYDVAPASVSSKLPKA